MYRKTNTWRGFVETTVCETVDVRHRCGHVERDVTIHGASLDDLQSNIDRREARPCGQCGRIGLYGTKREMP